jgi:EAL domain-containing protein (putative c-di-GMP-specific phosphodiesterase class I)
MGIAISSTGFARPEDALRDADAAMYRAKARGRARYEIADAELHARSLEQLEMESQLREAVDGGELRLHFQPVVVMETRALVGFEALVRWQHPVHGLRAPDDFIPLAEQTGIIMALGGGRCARRAGRCRRGARRTRRGDLWLSVNLSSRQFLHPQLEEEIHAALAETGFPPDRLRLEITESVIMDDAAAVGLILHRLRDSGIRVAIDDFGTGYSSLSYLHRLPLDTLKIDRSFVQLVQRVDPRAAACRRSSWRPRASWRCRWPRPPTSTARAAACGCWPCTAARPSTGSCASCAAACTWWWAPRGASWTTSAGARWTCRG